MCSNATAAFACLHLAGLKAGKDREDLIRQARRIMDWTGQHLQDGDKLYMDYVDPATGQVHRHKWTYNTAMMIRCHLRMHSLTGSAAGMARLFWLLASPA